VIALQRSLKAIFAGKKGLKCSEQKTTKFKVFFEFKQKYVDSRGCS